MAPPLGPWGGKTFRQSQVGAGDTLWVFSDDNHSVEMIQLAYIPSVTEQRGHIALKRIIDGWVAHDGQVSLFFFDNFTALSRHHGFGDLPMFLVEDKDAQLALDAGQP